MVLRLLLAVFLFHANNVTVLGVKGQDASTTVPEEQWYWARNDWGYLDRYCRHWDIQVGKRNPACVDVFSASRGFQKVFEEHGHESASYDVKTDGRFDITTKTGFKLLLTLGLQTQDWAFMPLAPPCSLFVGISSSVHRRSVENLLGDERRFCVRLSNLILANTVTFLLLMKYFRPRLCIMVEQPTSSWLFKQRCWKEVTKRWKLEKHLTHQGLFGHDLLKATHLMGNFSSLQAIETRATKDKKKAHKKEVKRRQARLEAEGQRPKSYYRRLPGGKFQGGPDLASSAVYPKKFVLALYKCWRDRETQWV